MTTRRPPRDVADRTRTRREAAVHAEPAPRVLARELWAGLAEGRWTLVDRFTCEGRRYWIVLRERPAAHAALTPRERTVVERAVLGKSNKLIAYELGCAESTIGTTLSSALRKLGVTSRVELIQLLHGLP